MESAAVLRSFQFSSSAQLKSVLERPGLVTINSAAFCSPNKLPVYGGRVISSTNRQLPLVVSCVKTSDATVTSESKGYANGGVLSDSQQNGVLEKKSPPSATFPNGFEALLTEVCDETKIAELKLKIGAFEINMKRKIESPTIPAPIVSETTQPSVPRISTPAVPAPPPKPSTVKVSPFTNISVEKAAKLAQLEASGSSGFVIISSPTVGVFRRARTVKGKQQRPACKEGDVIKENQVIGFVDQFSTELPVRSDVAGEVVKLLYSDGEPVGYGDPLIAVLPSFHSIRL